MYVNRSTIAWALRLGAGALLALVPLACGKPATWDQVAIGASVDECRYVLPNFQLKERPGATASALLSYERGETGLGEQERYYFLNNRLVAIVVTFNPPKSFDDATARVAERNGPPDAVVGALESRSALWRMRKSQIQVLQSSEVPTQIQIEGSTTVAIPPSTAVAFFTARQ
jgi:hypothetical protein